MQGAAEQVRPALCMNASMDRVVLFIMWCGTIATYRLLTVLFGHRIVWLQGCAGAVKFLGELTDFSTDCLTELELKNEASRIYDFYLSDSANKCLTGTHLILQRSACLRIGLAFTGTFVLSMYIQGCYWILLLSRT